MALEEGGLSSLMSLFNPQGPYDPALGSLAMSDNFDSLVPQFAAAGVRPPDLTQLASNESKAPHNLLRGLFGVSPTEMTTPDLDSGATPPSAITPMAPEVPTVAPAGGGASPSLNVPIPRPRPAVVAAPAVGAPLDIRPAVQQGGGESTDVSAQSKGKKPGEDLAKVLSGVKAPPNPEIQKITSPHVAQPHQINIQQGQLLAQLLHSITGGAPGATTPIRLGQALTGR